MRRLLPVAVLLVVTACTTDDSGSRFVGGSTPPATPTPRVSPAPGDLAPLPVPRTEVAGALWQGKIVVIGGYLITRASVASVDVYDPAGNSWSRGPDLPEPRNHAVAATVGDRLYVVGGYGGDGRATRTTWSLGPGETRWRDEPMLREARGALGLGAVGTTLVAFAGASGGKPSATSELLDAGAITWRDGPNLATAREHLAAAVAGGRVYAIAGRASGTGNFDVVESFAPGESTWRAEPHLLKGRGGIAGAAAGDVPCVAGGEESAGTIPSIECLRDGAWRKLADLAEPRHGLAVVALDGVLHVIAGGPKPGLFVSGRHETFRIPRSK